MKNTAKILAQHLLQIEAIKLNIQKPFTWASGWKSPIYCDNRKTLSYPSIRQLIYKSFSELISQKYPTVDVIAGVATGAIAHGVLVAEYMNKPFIYVRSKAKSHGLGNLIEGDLPVNKNVVVIEDLISTGSSSLAAVNAIRQAKANVLGLYAIFSYGFEKAQQNFEQAHCELDVLCNYNILIQEALEKGAIKNSDIDTLMFWRKSPETWGKI